MSRKNTKKINSQTSSEATPIIEKLDKSKIIQSNQEISQEEKAPQKDSQVKPKDTNIVKSESSRRPKTLPSKIQKDETSAPKIVKRKESSNVNALEESKSETVSSIPQQSSFDFNKFVKDNLNQNQEQNNDNNADSSSNQQKKIITKKNLNLNANVFKNE